MDKRGLSAAAIGAVVAAGLAGTAAGAGLVAFFGDRWGRRRVLLALSALGLLGGLGLAWGQGPWTLAALAFLGMVNGMGHDRGGAYALEQSALSGARSVGERTKTFAAYHAVGDAGAALGSLAAALVGVLGYHTLWLGYAAAMGAGLILYPALSAAVESSSGHAALSPVSA